MINGFPIIHFLVFTYDILKFSTTKIELIDKTLLVVRLSGKLKSGVIKKIYFRIINKE